MGESLKNTIYKAKVVGCHQSALTRDDGPASPPYLSVVSQAPMNYKQTSSASRSDKKWSAGSSKAGGMSSSWSSLLGGELWELEGTPDELLGLLSHYVGVWLNEGLDDVDGISSGTV